MTVNKASDWLIHDLGTVKLPNYLGSTDITVTVINSFSQLVASYGVYSGIHTAKLISDLDLKDVDAEDLPVAQKYWKGLFSFPTFFFGVHLEKNSKKRKVPIEESVTF